MLKSYHLIKLSASGLAAMQLLQLSPDPEETDEFVCLFTEIEPKSCPAVPLKNRPAGMLVIIRRDK
jgi:hypothetical protein